MRMREMETTSAASEVTERISVESTPGYQITTNQIDESITTTTTSPRTSPVLRILKRPNFHAIPVVSHSERTRLRPTAVETQNVDSPDSHQRNSTQCPPGQIPKLVAFDKTKCVECPKGYYRPRINIAMICRPCSPGFYQETSGQSYCRRCPNVPIQYLPSIRHRFQLRGFTSNEQCSLVDAYIDSNSIARSAGIQTGLRRSRYRYRRQ